MTGIEPEQNMLCGGQLSTCLGQPLERDEKPLPSSNTSRHPCTGREEVEREATTVFQCLLCASHIIYNLKVTKSMVFKAFWQKLIFPPLAWVPTSLFLYLIYPLLFYFPQTYFAILHPNTFAKAVVLLGKCMAGSHFFFAANLSHESRSNFSLKPSPAYASFSLSPVHLLHLICPFFVTLISLYYLCMCLHHWPILFWWLGMILLFLNLQCAGLCLEHNMHSLKVTDWKNKQMLDWEFL